MIRKKYRIEMAAEPTGTEQASMGDWLAYSEEGAFQTMVREAEEDGFNPRGIKRRDYRVVFLRDAP